MGGAEYLTTTHLPTHCSLLTAHYSLLTAHYHYSLLTTQLTTHCSLLTGLVEAAVAEDMHKWDHGSGAQQQRRPQLGLLVSRGVKLGLGLGLELGSGLGLRLQGATNYVLLYVLRTTY